MARNSFKNRKSESREIYEQAENAGRFAGNDADAKAARQQATENIGKDTGSSRQERDENESTNAEAGKDRNQSHNYKEEAQNVNDDTGRPLNEDETQHAKNKANEGIRQGRNES